MISTQNVMKYISRKQTSQMRRADWMLRKLCDWLTLWSPTFFWIRYHHAFFVNKSITVLFLNHSELVIKEGI